MGQFHSINDDFVLKTVLQARIPVESMPVNSGTLDKHIVSMVRAK